MTPTQTSDQTALEHLFAGIADAWTRGDAQAYGQLFSEDADYVAFDGSHQHGKASITTSHRELFEGPLQGSRMEGEITNMRFLTPGVAVLHAVGNTAFAWQPHYDPKRRSIQTFVAQKFGDDWRFVAFQNSRIRPITAFQRRMFGLVMRLKNRRR